MLARKLAVVSLVGLSLLVLTGCLGPSPWSRTGNQGGSTPISLGAKLLAVQQGSGSLQDLNPDDFQLMADLAGQFTGLDIPEVSDALADAAVQVIAANNLNSFDDLMNLENTNPEDIVIPEGVADVVMDEVEQLFGDLGDPADILDGINARYGPVEF
jgi:hypothetical protein